MSISNQDLHETGQLVKKIKSNMLSHCITCLPTSCMPYRLYLKLVVLLLFLQHLKDTYPQPAGVDLAPNVMLFMYHLSLAQAQECILEKSMMDNRKATIIGKTLMMDSCLWSPLNCSSKVAYF